MGKLELLFIVLKSRNSMQLKVHEFCFNAENVLLRIKSSEHSRNVLYQFHGLLYLDHVLHGRLLTVKMLQNHFYQSD
jgi:hypothetical protein